MEDGTLIILALPSGANHSRLTSITYPDGYVLTYNYASGLNGDISRLSSLSDSGGTLESYDYLGLGTMVRRSHPQPDLDLTYLGTGPGSGGDQYVGLDSFGRVIDHHWKTTGGTTDRFAYTYDRNSNRLTKGNAVNSDFDEAYTYDSLNQLTGFDRNSGDRTQAWDFDALGNWDSLTTDGGSPQTRTHNKQNEITAVSGATSPTFDANGNMTTDETGKQYVYDAWNRLKVVKNSGGTTLKTYVYDALNRRVAETAVGATTDFYYSASWQVLEERDAARTNDTKARYVWSPVYVDAMILRDRDTADDGTLEERLWVQQDANFNVTALVDNNGDVVERYVYDPYGVATVLDETWSVIGSSAYGWLHLHQGGRLDATSGLYHFRIRDFSPTLGRWSTRDPAQYAGGAENLYATVNNNTTNNKDAFGLIEEKTFDEALNYILEGQLLTQQQKDWIKNTLAQGCVGIVSVTLRKKDPKTDMPPLGNCYKSLALAEAAMKKQKCKKGCSPTLFSIHLWNDTGKDGKKPDVTFDNAGKATLSNWDTKARPKELDLAKGRLVEYTNYDFGVATTKNGVMHIMHANQYHNPDLNKDNIGDIFPHRPIAAMKVKLSTLQEWQSGSPAYFQYPDFNTEVWCTECNDGQYK